MHKTTFPPQAVFFKKIFLNSLLLAMLLCFSSMISAQEKLKVVTTASIFADMAEVIVGGEMEVQSIVPIGGDPHIYEPTPSDAQLVADADLVLCNGLTFEGWLNELIDNSGTKAKSVLITKNIQPIGSLTYENATDPHAWMDARNGKTYAENIKNALVELDPANREIYEFNAKMYQQQLDDLDKYIQQRIAQIPEDHRILITSHDAFQYYGRRYGLQLEAVLGTSTDADVQASDMKRLNEVIQRSRIPAIFIESTINPKLLEQIAADNGVKIGGKLFADSLGDKDSPAPTYIDMLRHNTNTIVNALRASTDVSEEPEPEGASGSSFALWGLLGLLLVGGFLYMVKKMNG